jgi:hypothetical protein
VIREAMRGTEALITAIDGKIASRRSRGGDTDKLEKGLFAVRNSYRSLFHNVDVELVKKESTRIQGELGKLDQQLQGFDAVDRERKLAGAGAVAAALLAALLCHLLKKTYD